MPPGSHKNLEAPAKQTEQAATAQPKWDVSDREQLNQIRSERTAAPIKSTPANVAQPQHRPEVRQNPTGSQAQPRPEQFHGSTARPTTRPDTRVGAQTRPETHPTSGRTNPEVAASRTTEINRSTINNRYESHNQSSTNNRYLYGGLAAGGLLGAGAASLYQNREYGQNYNGAFGNTYQFHNPNTYGYDNANNWNNLNNYSNYSNYDYANYNNYGNQGYEQYGSQLNYGDDQYDNQLADNSPYFNGGNSDDQFGSIPSNLYGDTTYGGAPFDGGIIQAPPINVFDSGYGRPNPLAAIPQLFGSLIGGVLGNITSSHHRRYYGGFPDC